MPVQGRRDLAVSLEESPQKVTLSDLTSADLEADRVEVLQLMFEVDERGVLDLLPPALRPTIPPLATCVFWRWDAKTPSEVTMAQVRVMTRAGWRSRGLLLASYCSGPEATRGQLQQSWAFDARDGSVKLRRFHERVVGEVSVGDRVILHAELEDPGSIAPEGIDHAVNLNVARLERSGNEETVLVQAEPEYRVEEAFRGPPLIESFSHADWNAEGLTFSHPVMALYFKGGFHLPAPRYLIDPNDQTGVGTKVQS